MDVNEHYAREYPDMQSQYKKIMQTPNFRVLIYNGDTDMACNFLGQKLLLLFKLNTDIIMYNLCFLVIEGRN